MSEPTVRWMVHGYRWCPHYKNIYEWDESQVHGCLWCSEWGADDDHPRLGVLAAVVGSAAPTTPSALRSVDDLLTPAERDDLRSDLAEIARLRRQATAEAGNIILGASAVPATPTQPWCHDCDRPLNNLARHGSPERWACEDCGAIHEFPAEAVAGPAAPTGDDEWKWVDDALAMFDEGTAAQRAGSATPTGDDDD